VTEAFRSSRWALSSIRTDGRASAPTGDRAGRHEQRFSFASRALPATIRLDSVVRRDLLRLFALDPRQLRPLWRQKFAARYRTSTAAGFSHLQPGNLTAKNHRPSSRTWPTAWRARSLRRSALRADLPLPDRALLPGLARVFAACYPRPSGRQRGAGCARCRPRARPKIHYSMPRVSSTALDAALGSALPVTRDLVGGGATTTRSGICMR